MLKRIKIENFRGFRHLAVDQDLNPVTVLMGPNSSGKTTVLQAIRLACQTVDLALQSRETFKLKDNAIQLASNTLVESPAQLLPLADWEALFVDQRVRPGATFTIGLTFDAADPVQALELVMTYANNRQLKFTLTVQAADAVEQVKALPSKSSRVNSILVDWLTSRVPKAVFIPPFYGVVTGEEYRPRVAVNRLLGSGDQSRVVRNLVAGLTSQQIDQMNAFLAELLGVTISDRTEGARVETESPMRVEFKDSNGPIELSAAGAGLVNLVALYASLARWQIHAKQGQVMFLLDEPEAHLHPRLQGETAVRLASLVTREFGAQLFMATHSVEIINRLGSRDHTLLARVERSATPSLTVLDGQQQLLGDLGDWADLTPFTAINFMAARRVLFHEGPSDAAVLRRCAKLKFRQQSSKWQAFERWTLVPLSGSGNDKAVDLLRRLMTTPLWNQTDTAAQFRIVQVLDRDHSRSPMFETSKAADQPDVLKVVWGQHSIESLFVGPQYLSPWIRAFTEAASPSNLGAVLTEALTQANQDLTLCDKAEEQLLLALRREPLQDDKQQPLPIGSDRHYAAAMAIAKSRVRDDPATVQRGKDRATFVLRQVKQHIDRTRCNNFPTDLIKLLERADLDRISNPEAAIPAEINQLLDWMVAA